MLFEQAAYEYVNDKQFGRKSVRPNTLEGYLSAIKCHLMPKWSGREIESITSDEMQVWVDSFERVGAAHKAFKTLRQTRRVLVRQKQTACS
jgi:hypothetical protein